MIFRLIFFSVDRHLATKDRKPMPALARFGVKWLNLRLFQKKQDRKLFFPIISEEVSCRRPFPSCNRFFASFHNFFVFWRFGGIISLVRFFHALILDRIASTLGTPCE